MVANSTENRLKNHLTHILRTRLTVRFGVRHDFLSGQALVFFTPLLQHRVWFSCCDYLDISQFIFL